MKNLSIMTMLFLSFSGRMAADNSDAKAAELATDVWKASGGENWPKVKSVRFSFIVEQDGKMLMKADHNWNVAAGTDEVKWKDKHVTVNITAPAQDEDSKAAHARWVNDSYWLLAPLKVRDPGVTLKYEGRKDSGGLQYETLRLSFDKVGLTPNDQYVFYIDPETKLVRAWDYIPKPGTVMHSTWEKYQTFGKLNLATEHSFAGKIIRLSGIEVTAAE